MPGLIRIYPFIEYAGLYRMARLVHNWAGILPLILLGQLVLAGSAEAGRSQYDMDKLLFAPHPFSAGAAVQSVPTASTQNAPAAPAQASPPAPAPAALDRDSEPESDDLDLDGLDGKDADEDEDINDPLEPMNRVIFSFNEFVNQYLLGPVAKGYNAVLPGVARRAIADFLANLNEPVVLANDLLQGEFSRGLNTGVRIIVNTTAGIGGFIDVAEKIGYPGHVEDFGQTLAVWGIGEGFYLVLPLLGPSNPRDAFGKHFVDSYFDPLGYYLDDQDMEEVSYGLIGLRGITTYAGLVEELDSLRESSIDFYGALRSLYRQKRKADIRNNASEELSEKELEID